MRSIISFLYPILLFVSCSGSKSISLEVNRYVDPFIGTTYTGHTFPGATYPLGMVQPGPQTGCIGWDYCAGYRYEDTLISGFSQNRLNGTGVPDMGDILIMPYSGIAAKDFKSTYQKSSEKATPGYYTVKLIDNSVTVELTATSHVAMHRYRFEKENPSIYINFQNGSVGSEKSYDNRILSATVELEDAYTITGYQRVKAWVERDIFYVIKLDKPILSFEDVIDGRADKAPRKIIRLANEKEVQIKVAFSMVSVEGAKKNLNMELEHWDFDQVTKETGNKWGNYLSRIEIEGDDDQKTNFYTALYHLLIQPNNIADVNGQYKNAKDSVSLSPFGAYYSTFSLWDTYRAAHPLYTILTPELLPDMINSMLLHAECQGYLPIWTLWGKETHCMIGNHAVPVIVEACLKDFPGIDVEQAYHWIKNSLTVSHFKYDTEVYDRYGYFPFDIIEEESVSRTLEGAYDDYCAAQLARKLGKDEDYAFFMNRSGSYKELFDTQTGLMRGKDSNGNWRTPFNAFHLSHAGTAGGDYTEGNAWQYTWHVQQDIEGLTALMGGKDKMIEKLDSLFVIEQTAEQTGFVGDVTGLIGQYAHGNEPSHHVIYMYTMLGRNDRTAELIREVFDRFYLPKPDGLCGNDDCGQMSAWYIFSALGFYPVDPVSLEYIIGAPQIPQARINLRNGKVFTMMAHGLSKENKYVESVCLNGRKIEDYKISYADIMEGGMLEFAMTDRK